jgi:hypothetical protein
MILARKTGAEGRPEHKEDKEDKRRKADAAR